MNVLNLVTVTRVYVMLHEQQFFADFEGKSPPQWYHLGGIPVASEVFSTLLTEALKKAGKID